MIGKKIRSIRKSKNMTIVELAEKINVTSGYISQ
ncbi:MAG: helix-turn-helix transcriptional regulator, partial [Tissierellia bacterium]|nr:helix-turn-helix transcriptional regulator [Tissierellia bacterium]